MRLLSRLRRSRARPATLVPPGEGTAGSVARQPPPEPRTWAGLPPPALVSTTPVTVADPVRGAGRALRWRTPPPRLAHARGGREGGLVTGLATVLPDSPVGVLGTARGTAGGPEPELPLALPAGSEDQPDAPLVTPVPEIPLAARRLSPVDAPTLPLAVPALPSLLQPVASGVQGAAPGAEAGPLAVPAPTAPAVASAPAVPTAPRAVPTAEAAAAVPTRWWTPEPTGSGQGRPADVPVGLGPGVRRVRRPRRESDVPPPPDGVRGSTIPAPELPLAVPPRPDPAAPEVGERVRVVERQVPGPRRLPTVPPPPGAELPASGRPGGVPPPREVSLPRPPLGVLQPGSPPPAGPERRHGLPVLAALPHAARAPLPGPALAGPTSPTAAAREARGDLPLGVARPTPSQPALTPATPDRSAARGPAEPLLARPPAPGPASTEVREPSGARRVAEAGPVPETASSAPAACEPDVPLLGAVPLRSTVEPVVLTVGVPVPDEAGPVDSPPLPVAGGEVAPGAGPAPTSSSQPPPALPGAPDRRPSGAPAELSHAPRRSLAVAGPGSLPGPPTAQPLPDLAVAARVLAQAPGAEPVTPARAGADRAAPEHERLARPPVDRAATALALPRSAAPGTPAPAASPLPVRALPTTGGARTPARVSAAAHPPLVLAVTPPSPPQEPTPDVRPSGAGDAQALLAQGLARAAAEVDAVVPGEAAATAGAVPVDRVPADPAPVGLATPVTPAAPVPPAPDVDALADEVYEQVRARLRDELLAGRERTSSLASL